MKPLGTRGVFDRDLTTRLGLILLLGAGLRFYGLYWGLPLRLHCDENKLLGVTLRLERNLAERGDLNPRFSAYGALPMYLALAGAPVTEGVARILGDPCDHDEAVLRAGRVVSALADVASIYLVFLLAGLVSVRAGLWAAALYSVALVAVRESHFFSPDALATCLVLLYVYRVSHIDLKATRASYALAGLALGLALSAKFSALPLALLTLVAFGLNVHEGMDRGGDQRVFRLKRSSTIVRGLVVTLWLVSLVPALMWVVGEPGLKSIAQHALTERVGEERLQSHSSEFWRAQVDALYHGISGLLIGVAAAATVVCAAAFFLLTYKRGPRACYETHIRLGRLALFALCTAATFIVLNPYSIIRPTSYWAPAGPDYVTWNILMVNGVLDPPAGWTLQFARTYPYLYQIVHVLPYAWGAPLAVVLLLGLGREAVVLARGKLGPGWVATAGAVILVLLMGRMWAKMVRYMLPLTPLLCAVAGIALTNWIGRGGRTLRGGLLGGTVATCVVSLIWCVGYISIYSKPDNRAEAIRWLETNAGPGDRLVYEKDDSWGAAGEAALTVGKPYTSERFNPLEFTHDEFGRKLSPKTVRRKERYLREKLAGASLLVVTDIPHSRLGRLHDSFPVVTAFHDRLFAGDTEFTLASAFEAGPSILHVPLDDSGAEETFRAFDHPKVYIFRRVAPAIAAEATNPRH